jgi:hypothetical protein
MKSFKQYITERQKKHSDMFLIFAGDIKLDMDNSCKIWEDCGKRSTFRHTTDLEGADFLINNKNKDVSISAFKMSSNTGGVETDGTVVTIVDGNYTIWWPADAFTFIGSDGKRWIKTNNQAFNTISSKGVTPDRLYNGDSEISPFRLEYLSGLYDLIASNTKLMNYRFVTTDFRLNDQSERQSISQPLKDQYLFSNKSHFVDTFYSDKVVEMLVNSYVDEHGEDKKFVKDALALQRKVLDKHSDTIKSNLLKIWKSARTTGTHTRGKYKHGGYDEAIIDNIKVQKLIFKLSGINKFFEDVDNILKAFEKLNKNPKVTKRDLKIKNLGGLVDMSAVGGVGRFKEALNFIDEGKTKGLPFTFMSFGDSLNYIKSAMKMYPKVWDYLEREHGIVKDKGVFLRKK